MKRFVYYIAEVFDRPLPWKWQSRGAARWSAFFKTETGRSITVEFDASRPDAEEAMDFWYDIKLNGQQYWTLTFSDSQSRYDTVDDRQQFPVFATVIDILKAFIREVHPAFILYSSEDDKPTGRTSLYRKFTKLAPAALGYEGREIDNGTFFLKRK